MPETPETTTIQKALPPPPTLRRALSPFYIAVGVATALVGVARLCLPVPLQWGNYYSLGLLALIGIVTVTGLLGQIHVSQMTQPRSHNPEKGWNETLGRYQLAYLNFYFAEFVAEPAPDGWTDTQVRLVFVLLIALTTLFWGLSNTKFILDQDDNIAKYHDCKQHCKEHKEDYDARTGICKYSLPPSVKWKIVRANASLALISLILAVIFALSPLAAGSADVDQGDDLRTETHSVELAQSPEVVKEILGPPGRVINLGSKSIYVYDDLKIIFVDGKVTDVN